MRSRGTLLLLTIALALGLYVWLVELRGSAERMRAETSERRVLDVQADAILALELPLTDGGHVRLVREGGWMLESPLEFPADEAAVERALKALSQDAFIPGDMSLINPPLFVEHRKPPEPRPIALSDCVKSTPIEQ